MPSGRLPFRLLAALVLCPLPAVAGQPDNLAVPERDGWTLTWSDDFSGAKLDPSKWTAITTGETYETSTAGFGETWGEECYDRAQVKVSGGALLLTAQRKKTACLGKTRDWRSGLVISRDLFAQTFGRFEARIRMRPARGTWSAFWMMPQVQVPHGACGSYWPCSGEIDILEYVGALNGTTSATETSAVYSTLHWGNAERRNVQESGEARITPDVDRWTVYAAEWDRQGISFFADDKLVTHVPFPLAGGEGVYSGAKPFDVPFYFILNQAVGGDWAGAPDAGDYPNTMKIDYVAAYRRP